MEKSKEIRTMIIINARNVNDAYDRASGMIRRIGVSEESRAGKVLVAPVPITTVYDRPMEKVLFSKHRRANPFFHLMESLWMLAGWNDARWLDTYIHDFSARFAEDKGRQHGAYGFRWRRHFDMEGGGCPWGNDQLEAIISLLKKNPGDRRVVLQMWDAVSDLCADVKDVPCNLMALPRITNGRLHLTIFNRSNDIVWGCYGANAVHFAFLLEYLAAMIGVEPGTMTQISNNWHAYEATADRLTPTFSSGERRYVNEEVRSVPLMDKGRETAFASDLEMFMSGSSAVYANSFFNEVAEPMVRMHRYRTRVRRGTFDESFDDSIDWIQAGLEWINR
jgi:thymidylate synthase